MKEGFCDICSSESEERKEEIEAFIQVLNHNIQYLGLEKEEVIKIVESLYK